MIAAVTIRIRYGGGSEYRDLTSDPLLPGSSLEQVLTYAEPIGNVVVSDNGRLFFTVHPEARPQGNKLLEWVSGASLPYPNGTVQPHLFNTVLGLTIDSQHRLWTIDHGRHGFGEPRLLAFDLRNGDLVHDHKFRSEVAPAGSFLQDVRVTQDGRYVIIADGSVVGKSPALVIYDSTTRHGRRLLENHPSVVAENYIIRNSIRDLTFAGGLFTLNVGVAGIEIDENDEWLYFAATNHDTLFRIRMEYVTDATLQSSQIESKVERYSEKPLSDGLSMSPAGDVLLTDVEHNAIFVVGDDREPRTLLHSAQMRWPASVDAGPDGYYYVSDSAFPELILQTRDHIKSHGPYSIFRFPIGQR